MHGCDTFFGARQHADVHPSKSLYVLTRSSINHTDELSSPPTFSLWENYLSELSQGCWNTQVVCMSRGLRMRGVRNFCLGVVGPHGSRPACAVTMPLPCAELGFQAALSCGPSDRTIPCVLEAESPVGVALAATIVSKAPPPPRFRLPLLTRLRWENLEMAPQTSPPDELHLSRSLRSCLRRDKLTSCQ